MEFFWQAMKLFILAVLLTPAISLAAPQPAPLEVLLAEVVGFGFEKNGEPLGIGVDIIKALDRVVDINIKPVVTPVSEINERLLSGDFDLVLIYKRTPHPLGTNPIAPIVSVSYLQISTKPYPNIESLSQSNPGFLEAGSLSPDLREILKSPRFYEDITHGFDALKRGEIDVFIGTRSNMSSGTESLNTLQTDGMYTRSFISTEIYVYAHKELLTENQTTELREAITALRESNVIRQIRRYYMSQSAKQ